MHLMEGNNMNKSIKESLFDFYSYALDHQCAGKTKTLLVWVFSLAELMVYTFNEVYKSGLITSSSAELVFSFLKYVQLEQLKSTSEYLYATIAFIIKALILLNFVVFLVFVFEKLAIFRIKKLRQIYCTYNFYKIFLFVVVFNESVLKDLISAIVTDFDPLMMALNLLALTLMMADLLKHSFFMQFEYFSNENCLVTSDDYFYVKMTSVKLLICFVLLIGLQIPNVAVKVISMSLLWLLSLISYAYYICRVAFENNSVRRWVGCLFGIYFSLTTALAISCFHPGFNFILGFVGINVASLFIGNLSQFDRARAFADDALKDPKDLLKYVHNLLGMATKCEPNSQAAIILKGQISCHTMKCVKMYCFCSKDSFYISSKNEFIKASQDERVGLFTKFLIKERLEDLCLAYPDSNFHKYVLALFCYKKIKNRLLALHVIRSAEKSQLSFSEQYKFSRLTKLISKDQEEFNKDRLRDKKFDELLKFEDTANHFTRLISHLFTDLNNFWTNMLNNYDICPDRFIDDTTRILATKSECKSLLTIMEGFSNYSDKIKFLHTFVKRELLNIKIVDKLDELYDSLDDKEEKSFTEDLTILNSNFYNTFLRNTSCVFEVGVRPNSVGIVQKISENVHSLFGCPRSDVIGKSINRLMPDSIASKHDQILLEVFEKGITVSKNNSVMSWALYKGTYPIQVKIKYKLDLTPDGNVVLTGIVVRVESHNEPNYYIMTDDFGFISSMSQLLAESLGIQDTDIEERRINVAMIAKDLIQKLPVQSIFQKKDLESSPDLLLRNNLLTCDQKMTLTLVKDPAELSEEINLFKCLKSIGLQTLDGVRSNKYKLVYDPTSHAYKISTPNNSNDINIETDGEHPDSGSRSEVLDFRQSNTLEAKLACGPQFSIIDYKDRIQKGLGPQDLFKYNYLPVTMDVIPRRHARIPNFNVFVIKKISAKSEFNSGRDRLGSKKTSKITRQYLEVGDSKEIVSLTLSNQIDGTESNYAKNHNEASARDDSHFSPYIKQTLNLFYKETEQTPTKRYPKIVRISTLVFLLSMISILTEVCFVITLKIPLLTESKQLSYEYVDMGKFERDTMKTYSYLISHRYARNNTTVYFFQRISRAMLISSSDSIMKYIFDPSLNTPYIHVFAPGYELTMNNAFLLQNYIFEMNKYLIGVESISDFTDSKHKLFMIKFKAKLSEFFFRIKGTFESKILDSAFKTTKTFSTFFFSWNGIIFVAVLYLLLYLNFIIIKVFNINDTILQIDDLTISSVINYYLHAQRFFNAHFNPNVIQDTARALEKSTMQSNILVRERTRKWRSAKRSVRRQQVMYNVCYLLLIVLWIASSLGRYYLELSLFESVIRSQRIGALVVNDCTAITLIILNAKDFFLRPESFNKNNQELIDSLDKSMNPQIVPASPGNAIETVIKTYYSRNVCDFIDPTLLPTEMDCSTVFNSMLVNNINTVKLLLKEKLGFLFSKTNMTAYNYKVTDITNLDDVSMVVENGFDQILNHWSDDYTSMIDSFSFLFGILTAAICVSDMFLYSMWVIFIVAKLNKTYQHERDVFMNFMPAETLKKMKLVQVHLIRDQVLKP